MPARKKKEDEFTYTPTPDRQLKTSTGWCYDGYHSDCGHRFSFGICGCDCHKDTESKEGQ